MLHEVEDLVTSSSGQGTLSVDRVVRKAEQAASSLKLVTARVVMVGRSKLLLASHWDQAVLVVLSVLNLALVSMVLVPLKFIRQPRP